MTSTSVIFDLDGTLVDSFGMAQLATNAVLTAEGCPILTMQEFKEGCLHPPKKRLAFHVHQDLDHPRADELNRLFDETYTQMASKKETPAFEHCETFLFRLKDELKIDVLGVVSNACGSFVRACIKVNELQQYFDPEMDIKCIGCDDAQESKPSPVGILGIVKRYNIDPKRSFYVGDSVSDGAAGRAAGLYTIGVTWGSASKEKLISSKQFDFVVETFDELYHVIHKHHQ